MKVTIKAKGENNYLRKQKHPPDDLNRVNVTHCLIKLPRTLLLEWIYFLLQRYSCNNC